MTAASIERDDPARRTITTPEGVPITIRLADRSTWAAAFLIDILILGLAVVILFLTFGLTLRPGGPALWVISGVTIFVFLLRSFYFMYFEMRWRGATPGKRMMGLKVIDRRGGQLTTEAVIARNLMREIEFFMPLSLLLAIGFGGGNQWPSLATLAWTSIFVLLPLFNRDRLRAGDIVGGTWVIVTPRAGLSRDIAGRARTKLHSRYAIQFTREQLDVYGIYELQTLEEVLRMSGPGATRWESEVAERIQRRIKWTPPEGAAPTAHDFLEAFYAALRGHLEQKMLFGERRKDKFHKTDKNTKTGKH